MYLCVFLCMFDGAGKGEGGGLHLIKKKKERKANKDRAMEGAEEEDEEYRGGSSLSVPSFHTSAWLYITHANVPTCVRKQEK